MTDMEDIVVYRSRKDGSLWARPPYEFDDGRFRALPLEPTPVKEGGR